MGFAGVGLAGAFLSNAVQLALAYFFIFGPSVRYLAPPFLAAGVASGFVLGLFCELFAAKSAWYRSVLRACSRSGGAGRAAGGVEAGGAGEGGRPVPPAAEGASGNGRGLAAPSGDEARLGRRENWDRLFPAGDIFAAGFLMTLFFLFNPSTSFRLLQFLFFAILAFVSGKKNKLSVTIPVILGIIFFNLLTPYGRVLAEWGPFRVTGGALLAGIRRAFTFEGLLMLSGACLRTGLRLPGSAGALLAESFGMLGELQERRVSLRPRHIVEDLDALLLGLKSGASAAAPGTGISAPRTALSCVILALMVSAAALTALAGAVSAQDLQWLPDNWG
jgi:hypothetical protein